MESLLQVLKRKSMLEEQFPILRSGFDDLDSSPAILRRRTVSLLGARPGMGRSTLAAQIAANVAEAGGRVGWFSTVRTNSEVVDKILRVKPALLYPQSIALEDRIGDVRELRFAITKSGKQFDLVVIDDLQGMYHNSRRGQVVFNSGLICSAIREVARTQNTAFLILSRLRRRPEYRRNHIPLPTDLPHWSNIKDAIDSVFLLYREGYYVSEDSRFQIGALLAGPNPERYAELPLIWDKSNSLFLPYNEMLV